MVGGSTVLSVASVYAHRRRSSRTGRPPLGLDGLRPATPASLASYFEPRRSAAHVHPLLPADVNANNEKVKTGADRLGFRNHLPAHNRIDCLACGFCALGCAYDRKADALTVQLPAASRRGALIIPNCRVDRIETRDGRVAGVTGTVSAGARRPAAGAAPCVRRRWCWRRARSIHRRCGCAAACPIRTIRSAATCISIPRCSWPRCSATRSPGGAASRKR